MIRLLKKSLLDKLQNMGKKLAISMGISVSLATSVGLSGCALSDEEACKRVEPQITSFLKVQHSFSDAVDRFNQPWGEEKELLVEMAVDADKFRVISSNISKIDGSAEFEKASLQFTIGLNEAVHIFDAQMKSGVSLEQLQDDLEAGLIMLRDVCPAD